MGKQRIFFNQANFLFLLHPKCQKEPVNVRATAISSLNGHAHHVQVVSDDAEMRTQPPSSPWGMVEGLARDIVYSPRLLPAIVGHHVHELIQTVLNRSKSPAPHDRAILMMPGYIGPNGYLSQLAKHLNWPALWHPSFNSLRLNRKIPDNAGLLAELLKTREAPTVAIAHSKGGPTVIHALKILQDLGLDHILEALILISPITTGVRLEITPIACRIPSRTIKSMLSGSPEVSGWEESLSEQNRAKILTVTANDGDQFTAKEQGVLRGSTMFLAPQSQGHIRQCVDPETVIFQVVISMVNAITDEIDAKTQIISQIPK